MDILYILIPLSALLVLGIVAVFAWAINAGQLDDLDQEGMKGLQGEVASSEIPKGRGDILNISED